MLVSRAGWSPVMVGRGGELAALRHMLDRTVRQGAPQVALLSGEAGIGKSRLLQELLAASEPATALVGQARQEDAGTPFGLLRHATAAPVGRWDAAPEPLGRYAHPLAHLLAPLLAFPDHPDDGHEHRTDELVLAGVELVRHLVGAGPAVLALEDLHWGDAESLLLFGRLAAEERLPALLVGSFRPEDYDRRHPLAGLLSELDRNRRATHVVVERLTRQELGQLLEAIVGSPVSDEVAELLHQRTRGNPFFVEELVAAVSSRDPAAAHRPDPLAIADAPLPWTAAEAVLRRLERLDAGDREVVDAASVLGERFAFSLLELVVDCDAEALLDTLSRLVALGIFEERSPDEFGFRHALTREAVAGELLARQRRRVHRRALEALRGSGEAHPGVLALHASGAGDGPAAVQHAIRAAERALRDGAPRHAARTARFGLLHDEENLALLSVAARSAAHVGDLHEAGERAERWAAAAARRGDDAEVAAAQCLLAWVRWSLGDRRQAWAAVERSETAAACGHPPVRARVCAVRAQMHELAGQSGLAITWADRALRLADEAGDRRVRAHALVTKGTALSDALADEQPQRVEQAIALLERGRLEAEAIGDVETLTRAYNNSLIPGQGVTSLPEAHALIIRARDVVNRYGVERFAAKLTAIEAYVRVLEGDAAAARRALSSGVRSIAPLDAFFWTALDAYLEAETGNPARSREVLDTGRRAVDGLDPGEPHVDFALAEGALAAAECDVALGESALRRAGRVVARVGSGSAAAWWEVALCALDAGVAPEVVADLRARQAPRAVRRHAGAVAHVEAALAAARGDSSEALAAYRRAVDRSGETRPAAMVASARMGLAEALARAGDVDAARATAAEALSLLARWPGHRRQALEALRRRLGEGHAPPHHLLTPREQEVCQLLAEGLSNREIGERLFISTKTASVHVSNILAKTGLRRRAQVAAWALQTGLAPHGRGSSRAPLGTTDHPPPTGTGEAMGEDSDNVVENLKGSAKRAFGAVSGQKDKEAEGRAQEEKAKAEEEARSKQAEAERREQEQRRQQP